MKAIKIILVLVVIAFIGFFAIKSIINIDEVGGYVPPINQFTEKLRYEIDTVLPRMSNSNFCPEKYAEIKGLISTWHKENRLGKDEFDILGNRLSKENFEETLYARYSSKFCDQAFYVFKCSEWKTADLNFIRRECQTLQKSSFLQAGPQADKFNEILQILAKYDEINGFIASCKNFGYLKTSLSDNFPVSKVQSKIKQAAIYHKNLDNHPYVKNCTRLHDGLLKVPQSLFRSHIEYLDNKIRSWEKYFESSFFGLQSDYENNLYKPLKAEIDALNNSIYGVDTHEEYNRLTKKWETDRSKADKYFSNQTSN
ncbi:MAG: hypothetical protein LBD80_02950 [Tannerella sp.]|jgi:hypothetical protein|nr:hypothetical protein [Tannerella sp.]